MFDLNENIAAREIMWHMLNIFWMYIIAFYTIEWKRDTDRTHGDENDDYGDDNANINKHKNVNAAGIYNLGDIVMDGDELFADQSPPRKEKQ